MKLGSFISLLLILLFTSQCLLQTCSAEMNRPARKLFNLGLLRRFQKWPFGGIYKPKPPVPMPKPGNPHRKYEWVGEVPDLIETLKGAACDHLVADEGKVSCVKKAYCKLRANSGTCRDYKTVCSYGLHGFPRVLKVTNLQRTCGDICFDYKYHPNNNKSTCERWIRPIAY